MNRPCLLSNEERENKCYVTFEQACFLGAELSSSSPVIYEEVSTESSDFHLLSSTTHLALELISKCLCWVFNPSVGEES